MPAWLLFLLALLYGAVEVPGPEADCNGHWHSTFKVYVDGEEVLFDAYSLEDGTTPMHNHLHRGDAARYTIHVEPVEPRCIAFEDFARDVDMRVTADRLVLEGHHEKTGQAGIYEARGGKSVEAFHDAGDGWKPVAIRDLNARSLQDGERLLVLYGAHGEDEVQRFQESVPPAFSPA